MTIDEIREWRSKIRTSYWSVDILLLIDTLLAEVERLERHNANADQWNAEQDQKLTVATEALRRIESWEHSKRSNGALARLLITIATQALKEVEG